LKKILFMLLIFCVIFTACGQKDSTKEIKEIKGDNSYSAIVDIVIHGNKADSKYKVKQYYVYPDKLRIETLEPEFLKKKVIIKNGEKWRLIHPLINQTINTTKLMDKNEQILIGVIEKSFFEDYKKNVTIEEYKNEKFICIKKALVKSNTYRSTAVLYLNKESKKPCYLNILDQKGNLKVEINYANYDKNSSIQDSLFFIN
jgi:outer membrane lipoprotein-sorting protein